MRLEAYYAKVNNTLPAFQQSMQNLAQTYANIRIQLLNPSPSIREALRKLYRDESNKNAFRGGFEQSSTPNVSGGGLFGGGGSSSNTLFGGGSSASFGSTQTGRSIFGGGGNSSTLGSSNLFGGSSAQQQPSSSIFGGGSAQQSNLSSNQQQTSSIFGGSSAQQNVSSNQHQTSSIFGGNPAQGSSIFGGGSAPPPSVNPFASFQQPKPHQATGSIFSSQASNPSGMFNSPTPQNANNVFGQPSAMGNIFSNNVPGASPGTTGGIFGNTALSGGNTSTLPSNSSEAEGMNEEAIQEASPAQPASMAPPVPAHNNTPSIPPDNPFQAPVVSSTKPSVATGLFGQVIHKAEDPCLFSKLEELNPSQVEAFKTLNFVLGQIPEVPPPRELCV
eukprot:TRINITY_DN3712_c0_g1_i3.p1 TRINITY_DN3712_c0_g1~~TRINITY_DN3712_c0_g1_i3.p1  ORF type:complete len:389 (+),score=72.11 TRINITY_DN3712_c0_g1_i3:206-1372(+)